MEEGADIDDDRSTVLSAASGEERDRVFDPTIDQDYIERMAFLSRKTCKLCQHSESLSLPAAQAPSPTFRRSAVAV